MGIQIRLQRQYLLLYWSQSYSSFSWVFILTVCGESAYSTISNLVIKLDRNINSRSSFILWCILLFVAFHFAHWLILSSKPFQHIYSSHQQHNSHLINNKTLISSTTQTLISLTTQLSSHQQRHSHYTWSSTFPTVSDDVIRGWAGQSGTGRGCLSRSRPPLRNQTISCPEQLPSRRRSQPLCRFASSSIILCILACLFGVNKYFLIYHLFCVVFWVGCGWIIWWCV